MALAAYGGITCRCKGSDGNIAIVVSLEDTLIVLSEAHFMPSICP